MLRLTPSAPVGRENRFSFPRLAAQDEFCCLFPLGQNRAMLLVRAQSFIEIPENVVIDLLTPGILDWAYCRTSAGPYFLLFLEKGPSDEWPDGLANVSVEPFVAKARLMISDLSELSPSDIAPTILNLALAHLTSSNEPTVSARDIVALTQELGVERLADRSVRGWLISQDEATLIFRTFVPEGSLPTAFLVCSNGELQFASPLDIKLTVPDANGVHFVEISVRLNSDGGSKGRRRIDALHMLSRARLTRIIF